MCYTALAGLAITAAGTAASMKASSDAKDASNQEIENSLALTKGYQDKATPLALGNIANSGFTQSSKDITSGKGQANQLYDTISKIPLSTSTSPLPIDESRLEGQLQNQRDAAATSQGYGNMALLRWLQNQDVSRNLGVISGLAGNAGANAGTLAQLAQQKSAGLAGIGSLLSTGGNLAAIYGGLNANRGFQLTPPGGKTQLQQQYGPQ